MTGVGSTRGEEDKGDMYRHKQGWTESEYERRKDRLFFSTFHVVLFFNHL